MRILVGVGTRLGKGCTSGHGVCGVGSLSNTSFVNVATFLAFAIGTAQLVAAASELRAVAMAGGLRAEDVGCVSDRGSHEVLRLQR